MHLSYIIAGHIRLELLQPSSTLLMSLLESELSGCVKPKKGGKGVEAHLPFVLRGSVQVLLAGGGGC